jgi:hypothetical protein
VPETIGGGGRSCSEKVLYQFEFEKYDKRLILKKK